MRKNIENKPPFLSPSENFHTAKKLSYLQFKKQIVHFFNISCHIKQNFDVMQCGCMFINIVTWIAIIACCAVPARRWGRGVDRG